MEGTSIVKTTEGYEVRSIELLKKKDVKRIIKNLKNSIVKHEQLIKDLEEGLKGAEFGVHQMYVNLKNEFDKEQENFLKMKTSLEAGEDKAVTEIVTMYIAEMQKKMTGLANRLTNYDKQKELEAVAAKITPQIDAHLEEKTRYEHNLKMFKNALTLEDSEEEDDNEEKN